MGINLHNRFEKFQRLGHLCDKLYFTGIKYRARIIGPDLVTFVSIIHEVWYRYTRIPFTGRHWEVQVAEEVQEGLVSPAAWSAEVEMSLARE
jgi:hypothetical protein